MQNSSRERSDNRGGEAGAGTQNQDQKDNTLDNLVTRTKSLSISQATNSPPEDNSGQSSGGSGIKNNKSGKKELNKKTR